MDADIATSEASAGNAVCGGRAGDCAVGGKGSRRWAVRKSAQRTRASQMEWSGWFTRKKFLVNLTLEV